MPEVLRGVLSVKILVKKSVVTRAQERVWMERAVEKWTISGRTRPLATW